MKKFTTFALSMAVIIGGFISCDMATNTDDTGETGKLSVQLTDDPFPIDLVSAATVKIDSVVVREKDESNEGNPFITLTTESKTYNLLDLQNGVTASLPELEIPAGIMICCGSMWIPRESS